VHYGEEFLFGFKARKQAHSKLCNCFRNAEAEQKYKSECTSYKIPIPKEMSDYYVTDGAFLNQFLPLYKMSQNVTRKTITKIIDKHPFEIKATMILWHFFSLVFCSSR